MINCSAMRPTRVDSASEIPGLKTRLMVKVPSLKGGRNARGSADAATAAASTATAVVEMTMRGNRKDKSRRTRLQRLSTRTNMLSRAPSALEPGSM
jgi:hypothetical protein